MSNIAWPTLANAVPASLDWRLRASTQVFVSPLSGEVQTLELPGARWVCSFAMAVLRGSLSENDAGILAAFIVKLRGQANRAQLYPFNRPRPLGSIPLTGVTLNGAVSAGASQATFAGAGNVKTLQTGDYFAVAGELKMVVDGPYTSNSGGALANVKFEPPARTAWTDTAAITLDKPTALFILQDPEAGWRNSPGDVNEFSLAFVEVFS